MSTIITSVAQASGQKVPLICGSMILFAELFPSMGERPAYLSLPCPRCRRRLEIPPEKGVEVEPLDPPLKASFDGERYLITARVSVKEVFSCSHPAENGKGKCGFRMKLTSSVLSQV